MDAADDDADEEKRRRPKGSTGPTQDEELLAKRLALLSDERRQYYQNTVDFVTEEQACEASVTFRLGLAKTYLQKLAPREETNQIADISRTKETALAKVCWPRGSRSCPTSNARHTRPTLTTRSRPTIAKQASYSSLVSQGPICRGFRLALKPSRSTIMSGPKVTALTGRMAAPSER